MKGQRGWRELTELGEKTNKISGMLEGIIWSPKSGDSDNLGDGWDNEEVNRIFCFLIIKHYFFLVCEILVITFSDVKF